MTRTPRIRLAAALAVVLLLGAACANDDATDAGAGDTGATGGTAETGPMGPTAGTGSTGDDDSGRYDYGGGGDQGEDDGGGGGPHVDVQANNFAFSPTDVEIEAGEDIHVRNGNASTPHTFTVDGTDIDLDLSPQQVQEAVIDLEPGTYDFVCRFHPQMTGTLTVV
jgi:plastocyanin